MVRLEQDVPPPSILDTLDWTGSRANDRDVLRRARGYQLAEPITGANRELRGRILLEPAEDDVRQTDVWRVRRAEAPGHFFLDERPVIVRDGVTNGVMPRDACLNEHSPALRTSPRA